MLQRRKNGSPSGVAFLGSAWLGAWREQYASGTRNVSSSLTLNQCLDAVLLLLAAHNSDRVACTWRAIVCLDRNIKDEPCGICSERGGLRPSSQPERL